MVNIFSITMLSFSVSQWVWLHLNFYLPLNFSVPWNIIVVDCCVTQAFKRKFQLVLMIQVKCLLATCLDSFLHFASFFHASSKTTCCLLCILHNFETNSYVLQHLVQCLSRPFRAPLPAARSSWIFWPYQKCHIGNKKDGLIADNFTFSYAVGINGRYVFCHSRYVLLFFIL